MKHTKPTAGTQTKVAEETKVAEGTKAIEPDFNEAIKILTKASVKVYTKGGNQVYAFLKHARKYIMNCRKEAEGRGRARSAEVLNEQFAAIFAE